MNFKNLFEYFQRKIEIYFVDDCFYLAGVSVFKDVEIIKLEELLTNDYSNIMFSSKFPSKILEENGVGTIWTSSYVLLLPQSNELLLDYLFDSGE